MSKEVWLDRFIYRMHRTGFPDDEWNNRLRVGFCPEGAVSEGEHIHNGEWWKEIVKVESRYKKIQQKGASSNE